jgi:hypothetical protein
MAGAMFSAEPLESPDCYLRKMEFVRLVCHDENLKQISGWEGGRTRRATYLFKVLSNDSGLHLLLK